ncbi:hypothetical protein K6U44_13940 [Vibrio parahaemolyticus]|uniref:hypothetical protein n=1 Tax=Vibrio parahaemolyticus TaxID=670 RepID=UPI00084AAF36|nr:hypothetical protein [Vibrio parahaemolyticus]EJC1211558.1 hypothetical protein [Vibrio parahaemolyticus]EJG0937356.1 hypothetical protein [Vibrio parahaemolyticus]EJG1997230.1 hypothetical protein [Vibrio parahaemolyticus]MCG6461536.1 hypothetical protein [Vibrio parahaemolyticus]OEB83480.1 hypothetical protein BBM86_08970 [Vibrio parahaemolyticus]
MVKKPINCFVIMPISSQEGYEDDHFQLVYEDIICPAILAAGMTPIRADETKGTNLIQLDILQKVIDSPMAVCDMSAKNPNVFYELGMRQAFDKPTVLLKDEKTNAPFYINGLRYCQYNTDMRHRNVKLAIEQLSATLIETYKNKENKSEINSLVRLLELAKPAELPTGDITPQEKEAKLLSLKLDTVINGMEQMQQKIQYVENKFEHYQPSTKQAISEQSASFKGLRHQLRAQRQSNQDLRVKSGKEFDL